MQFEHKGTQSWPVYWLDIRVPQGSILRPVLFLLNFNDIINASDKVSFAHFADDATESSTIIYFDENTTHTYSLSRLIYLIDRLRFDKLTYNVDTIFI